MDRRKRGGNPRRRKRKKWSSNEEQWERIWQRRQRLGAAREDIGELWCRMLLEKGKIRNYTRLPPLTPYKDFEVELLDGRVVGIDFTGPNPNDISRHRIKCDPRRILTYPIELLSVYGNEKLDAALTFLKAVKGHVGKFEISAAPKSVSDGASRVSASVTPSEPVPKEVQLTSTSEVPVEAVPAAPVLQVASANNGPVVITAAHDGAHKKHEKSGTLGPQLLSRVFAYFRSFFR